MIKYITIEIDDFNGPVYLSKHDLLLLNNLNSVIQSSRKKLASHLRYTRKRQKKINDKKIEELNHIYNKNIQDNNVKLECKIKKAIKWAVELEQIEYYMFKLVLNKIKNKLDNSIREQQTRTEINKFLRDVLSQELEHLQYSSDVTLFKNHKIDLGEIGNIKIEEDDKLSDHEIIIKNNYLKLYINGEEEIYKHIEYIIKFEMEGFLYEGRNA